VYKPNIGRQSQLETLDSLCRKFHRVRRGPELVTLSLSLLFHVLHPGDTFGPQASSRCGS
jgi:hypothetical protein